MRGGSTSNYPEFPKIETHIGENPARFLDRPLFGGGKDVSSPFYIAKARIDGIDRLEVVNAWIAVERNPKTRGPRDKVLSLLEDRKRHLEEHGERPEEFDIDRNVETVESVAVWPDREDGERSFLSVRSEKAVATDGGEDS